MRPKKQSVASKAGTLHAFFSTPTTKPSGTPSRRNKPAAPASKAKAKFVPPADAEIIVIDSDDDAPSPPRQKRKADDTCGDVEIVQSGPSPLHSAAKRPKLEPETAYEPLGERMLLLSSRSANSPTPGSSRSSHFASPSHPPAPKSHPDASESSYAVSVCQSPTILHETPNGDVRAVLDLADNVIEIDDEWGTGDDEVLQAQDGSVIDLEDDDGAAEAEPEPGPSDVLESCPFCAAPLRGLLTLKVQLHIDTCAEAQEAAPMSALAGGTTSANAFSVLMSSHTENQAWKEAAIAEDPRFRATKTSRRHAPFYKVMTGMPIAVDAFRYGAIPGVTAYFLTHAHSDHYTNLSSSWKAGPVYCSEGTANLIIHMLAVDRKWVHPLPMDTPTTIPNTGGVTVTLIEANHCPGSSLFMFEGKQTVNAGDSTFKSAFVGSSRTFRYLHCGDFRASPQHVLHPAVNGKRIDTIYLDTTYLSPKHMFPAQKQVISACAELAKKLVTSQYVGLGSGGTTQTMNDWFSKVHKTEEKKTKPARTLVIVGTYSIGKERIVKAIAKTLGTTVYCDSRKDAILRCQPDPELHALLSKDPYSSGVHLVPLSVITSDRIAEYTQRWKGHWATAIGFRPTGWTYTPPAGADTIPSVASVIARAPHREFGPTQLRPMRNSTATHQLFGVPYSEHSSFFELTCFALSLDWARVVATVNVGSEASRGRIAAWVGRWEAERKRRGGGVVPYRTPEYW